MKSLEEMDKELLLLTSEYEALSNLVIDTMTVGELSHYLKTFDTVTNKKQLLELNIEKTKKILENNSKISEF